MKTPGIRWRWLVLGTVVILAFVAIRLLDQPFHLESYQTLDDQTLAVVGYGAPYSWPRVTVVAETDSTVTITVNVITLQLGPSTAVAARLYVPVYLSEPLEGRTVIDGSTGQEIPNLHSGEAQAEFVWRVCVGVVHSLQRLPSRGPRRLPTSPSSTAGPD